MSTAKTNEGKRSWWARYRKLSPRFGLKSLLLAIAIVALLIQIARFLDPRVHIEGRVVFDDGGRPAADVRVYAQPVNRGGHSYYREADSFTDNNGRFVLTGLRKGKYNVFVDAGDEWVATALDSFNATPRKTKAPPIQLVKGFLIKGQLVDVENGKPITVGNRTVRIGLHGPSRPRSGAAIDVASVRPDGSFQIRGAPGKNILYLTAPGAYKSNGPFQLSSFQAGYLIDAKEGEVISLDFEVSPLFPTEGFP